MAALGRQRLWSPGSNPEDFGQLHDSAPDRFDSPSLRQRLADEGYLVLSNCVDTQKLRALRHVVSGALGHADAGDGSGEADDHRHLDTSYRVLHDIGQHPAAVSVVRDAAVLELFSRLFDEPAMAINHVWIRACGTGRKSDVHCDWVYMGRGSQRLLTAWMPLVDVPIEKGPLMILERSHRGMPATRDYLRMDADRLGLLYGLRWKHGRLIWGGRYSTRADLVARDSGARWLTRGFKAGDVAIFSPMCVHATLPNLTDELRLSIDARFQPVRDPVDERFAGTAPAVHANRDRNLLEHVRQIGLRLTSIIG